MSKSLKPKRHKIEKKKPHEDESRKIVLVATYKTGQLEKWPGYYNYPLYANDKVDLESAKKVNELWLFSGAKVGLYFAAECLGEKTREELRAFGYPSRGKGHAERYLLFRVTPQYGPSSDFAEAVVIRTKDFSGQKNGMQRKLKAYLESPDRKDPFLAKMLPKLVTDLPRNVLRVCEAAVQMDFMCLIDAQNSCQIRDRCLKEPRKAVGQLKCLDFFAGSGLVSKGLSSEFSTVWANDISVKKAQVFNANNDKGVLQVCPIENVQGACLPCVDLSWGSFPCQDLSLAGDMNGLYAQRSGLFWQWLRVMDEMPTRPAVVVAENVVGLVSAKGGEYYVAVHNELLKRGYRVGAVMIDAIHWLPQSRKRIFVVGVRDDVDVSKLTADAPTWCHPAPIINVSKRVRRWTWWKIPQPRVCPARLDEVIDFDAPCDASRERAEKLSLIHPKKVAEAKDLARTSRMAFTGYRRTRDHKQVLEIRTDGVAGCLRTPCGGSSRQIVLIANGDELNTRLLTVREAARLMGAPDTYEIPGSYNDGYMAMGDAVAVPVVEHLSKSLLAPLARLSKRR